MDSCNCDANLDTAAARLSSQQKYEINFDETVDLKGS